MHKQPIMYTYFALGIVFLKIIKNVKKYNTFITLVIAAAPTYDLGSIVEKNPENSK